MVDLATATEEQLQQALQDQAQASEAARAELQRRADEAAARLEAAQLAWDRKAVEAHQDLDVQLMEQGQKHGEAFDQAVAAGDLNAVLAAWIAQRATRDARSTIRDAAANGEVRARTGQSILPHLAYRTPNLLTRLEEVANAEALRRGIATADAVLGERPTEVDQ